MYSKILALLQKNQLKKVFVQWRPLVRNNILIRNDIVNFDLFYLFKYENNFGMSRPTKPSHPKAAQAPQAAQDTPIPPKAAEATPRQPKAAEATLSHPKAAQATPMQPKPSPLKAAQTPL